MREVCAVASLAGIVLLCLAPCADPRLAPVAGLACATGARLLAMRYGWNLPRAGDPDQDGV